MNCFAHACRFLDNRGFAAGSCIPDWLGMIDRSVRVRRKGIYAFLSQPDLSGENVQIAHGILQHFDDDDWFHASESFTATSLELSRMISKALGQAAGHRSGFLGHILVELLLDACLEEQSPGTMDRYYQAMEQVPVHDLETTINRIANRQTDRIGSFMDRYLSERFLLDYLDDGRLLYRVNRVLLRVGLEPLDERSLATFAEARVLVRSRQDQLLAGWNAPDAASLNPGGWDP